MEKGKNLLEMIKQKESNVSRRTFLKTCGLSVLALGLPLHFTKEVFAAEEAVTLGATQIPDHLTLTWANNPTTTQTVVWRTDTTITQGTIQYVEGHNANWERAKSAAATADTLSTNLGDMHIQSGTITGLKPATSYTYRVGDGTSWSDAFSFTTEPAQNQPFKFLLFGDSQSGQPKNPEYGPWGKTVNNAYKAVPDAAFMMVVGDLVEVGQNQYAHWNNWYQAAKDVIDKLPHMAVMGNHETYDTVLENHSTRAIYFSKQYKLPDNGPEELKGEVYSFDYGDAHFAVIDSQEAEEGPYVPDMLAKEAAWLDQDLAASKKTWKFVFFHKTPYYNKAVRANEKLKAVLLPIFDKHHVDLVFNGHDHGYSRTYPLYQDSFVSTPAKGTVYVVTGRSGNKYYTDLTQKIWDAFFFDPQAEPNYLAVAVDGKKVTIKAYTQSGELIDIYEIDKATGTDYPKTILPERVNDTRMVIWGNMLQTPLVPVGPQKINGAWHVPLRPFVEFIGGSIEAAGDGKILAACGKDRFEFQAGTSQVVMNRVTVEMTAPLTIVKDVSMIAADDVKKLFGFGYKYDEQLNMVLLAK